MQAQFLAHVEYYFLRDVHSGGGHGGLTTLTKWHSRIPQSACVFLFIFCFLCVGGLLPPHCSGEWKKNTNRHPQPLIYLYPIAVGKLFFFSPCKTFFSGFISWLSYLAFHSVIPTLSLCACVLSGLVSLLWANLCQC